MSDDLPEVRVPEPEEVRERYRSCAHWLWWDADEERPKKPLNSDGYGASWTNPDEWVSFEEAREHALKKPSRGIGYVFAGGIEEAETGTDGALDLDGIAESAHGSPKDWVPSMQPFFEHDAFIEWSPSATGHHVPLKNFEVPEWWSDCHFSDDEHEGVEAYDKKFFTVTGDQLKGSGDEPAEAGEWVHEWLREAYKAITGEDPLDNGQQSLGDSGEGETPNAAREEFLDESDIRDALDHVDPDVNYPAWRDIGFALVDFFDSDRTAMSVFRDWSRRGSMWDSEAPERAERIIGDAGSGGGRTIGTVVYHAKRGGWEMPTPSGESPSNDDGEPAPPTADSPLAEAILEDPAEWFNPETCEIRVRETEDHTASETAEMFRSGDLPDDVRGRLASAALDGELPAFKEWSQSPDDWSVKKASDGSGHWEWQMVRSLYGGEESDVDAGRKAAEDLLRERYDFMTLAESDELHVYDEATGVFTDDLSEVKAEIHAGLGKFWSTHQLNEIEARLRQQPVIESRYLNGRAVFDDPHVCVENGVLNLLTRELLDHSPEYRFVDRVPVTYDPNADTTPYEEVLDEWTEREADAKAMMEMVGHALHPTANERYKKFLILTGDSNNGKTVFFDRVTDLLNGSDREERNVSNVKLGKLGTNQFSTHSIYGHMANVAGEINGKKIRNTASLKDISGGEQVELEPKGKDPYFDTVNATLMFAANDPPLIGERDREAIGNRIVPIELPNTFTKNPDPDDPTEKERVPKPELKARLTSDEAMSGFLNLALDGLSRLEMNGDVSLPESPADRLRKYEKNADPMKEFAHECLANDTDDYVVKADVTSIYKAFATANGYETGSNIHSTLHSVIQSVPDLTHSTSYKRAPSYTGTSLPLRGWDDRKTVVDRLTLSETGLEYARAKGLVDESEIGGDADDAVETGPTPLAELETGRHDTLTVTLAGILDPAPWLEEEGWFKGEGGFSLDYRVRGGRGSANPLAGASEGDEVVIRNAAVRTDDDGLRYVELDGRCDVERINARDGDQSGLPAAADGGQPDDRDDDPDGGAGTVTDDGTDGETDDEGGDETGTSGEQSAATGTTDAGVPADAEGARADAQRLAKFLSDTGKTKSRVGVIQLAADRVDVSPDRAEKLLDYAVDERGIITEHGDDGYSASYP